MRWASSISTAGLLPQALDECAQRLQAALDDNEPDLLVVFAHPAYERQVSSVAAAVHERFPHAKVLGCTGAGIIGGGREVEGVPAFSMTAAHMPGVNIA
jgi:small ligand-binding sensory domain FIST